ncbi:MAG: hypothetical protein HY821_08610 [Acidobacteria bacterium]|nr:hypothetical protein [Acidobacteriota bacterium]
MRWGYSGSHERGGHRVSPLSNWPRYPGGAVAGALVGVASVLVFFLGAPSVVPVFTLGAAAWVLLACLSDD